MQDVGELVQRGRLLLCFPYEIDTRTHSGYREDGNESWFVDRFFRESYLDAAPGGVVAFSL